MNFTHKAWVKLSAFLVPKAPESKEKGAGFVEYAALLLLVAGIAFLVLNLGLQDKISQTIGNAVSRALDPPK